jgi:Ca-activated chloride channel family protein
MTFAHPENLVFLWVLPLVAAAYWMGYRRIKSRMHRFAAKRGDEILTRPLSAKRFALKGVLASLAAAFIVIALAEPRLGFEWRELPHGGIDVMVVLDISRSMESADITPTRLERAKRKISDLLTMLEGDRIGIIGFAGVPFVHCPLTTDYRLAKTFLAYIGPDLMPVQGTAIGDAIHLAVERLTSTSKTDSEGKAIVLITDGEDQESDPMKAAEEAKAKGIKVFAIGVGSPEGAPIPLPDGGFKKDKAGNVVISKMDEETLKKIALTTGGTYVRSVSGDLDLSAIYKAGIRGKVGDVETGVSRQKIWYERFQWFLTLALILLIGEFFVSEGVRRQAGIGNLSILLGTLILAGSGSARADDAKNAVKAYKEKDYDKAAQGFLNAEIADPKQPAHSYNRGLSQFQAGNFDGAIEGFAKSAAASDKKVSANAYYNLGNTLVAKGKLEEAVSAYQKALQANPQDAEAKDNMEWVAKQIEKQKQQSKDQDKQDQNDKKEDQDKSENQDHQKDQDKKDDQQQKDQQQQQDSESKPQDQKQKSDDQQPSNDQKQDQDKQKEGGEAPKPENSADKKKEPDSQAGSDQGQKNNEKAGGQKLDPKNLSKKEAEELLDAIDTENGDALPRPQIPGNPQQSDKDW